MSRALTSSGIKTLFPIQAVVLPLLLHGATTACDESSPYSCDVCVAAPTGQGKTLAYALPIVQSLLHRVVACPRALIVLPTRDLALQVYRVFEMLRQGLGAGVVQVRAQCLIGQRSFAEETRALLANPPDILVCTPGRLADHVLGREGKIDVSALRWFVIDEADRLLTQTYHRWLDVLERAALGGQSSGPAKAPRLQKLLFSATMTWNPQKLATLKLHRPMYFFSSKAGRHSTPAELRQHYVNCKVGAKPLSILHILSALWRGELGQAEDRGRAIIFCSSVDTAHRLARLLQICSLVLSRDSGEQKAEARGLRRNRKRVSDNGEEEADEEGEEESDVVDDEEEDEVLEEAEDNEAPEEEESPTLDVHHGLREPSAICEFSSTLSQRERTVLLNRFRRSQVRCLVCSDVVARGIDIPEVGAVINYSVPNHLQTYIHRVGRTARAGRIGHTFTFVQRKEMDHFEKMLRKSADCWEKVSKFQLPRAARNEEQQWYPQALNLLKKCLELEERGKLPSGKAVSAADLWGAEVTSSPSAAGVQERQDKKTHAEMMKNTAQEHRERASSKEAVTEVGSSDKKKRKLKEEWDGIGKLTPKVPEGSSEATMFDYFQSLQEA